MQSVHDLHREGDFGQEIEHLLVLLDSFLDQMNVDFRLAAGGYAMEQYHIVLHYLHQDAIISILLGCGERLDEFEVSLARGVEPANLKFVRGEDALVKQRLHDGCRAMALVHKFFLRHSLDALSRRISLQGFPTGKIEEGGEHLRLLQGALQHVERHVQGLLIAIIAGKLHIEFHLGLKLLGGFQSGWHGCIIDIAQWRHIVTANPLPQAQLLGQERRLRIEHHLYRLAGKLRFLLMHPGYHGYVFLALAQRHKHSDARHHLPFHPVGDRISKGAIQWQGQNYVYIFHFSKKISSFMTCKDSKKKADTHHRIPAFIYFKMYTLIYS